MRSQVFPVLAVGLGVGDEHRGDVRDAVGLASELFDEERSLSRGSGLRHGGPACDRELKKERRLARVADKQ
ncbi:hypothetical protein [Streptomyces celluloflavus]|uniref:hypothetical protein n=1 Tax=Streptomyces celluloflavus TaxID=58344 RepID=UPI0036895016